MAISLSSPSKRKANQRWVWPRYLSFQPDADQMCGQIVIDPILRLGKQGDGAHPRFLVKLAIGSRKRLLALVDAALGHLPELRRTVKFAVALADAPTRPDKAFMVQNHDADAGAIGKLFGDDRTFVFLAHG